MPLLVFNQGAPDEKTYFVPEAVVTVGRSEDQPVCIPHKSLSRCHARIEPRSGRFFVVDLQSKNGTFVNGRKIGEQEIRHGDTLTLGDLDLLFTIPKATAASTLAAMEPLAVRPLVRAPITKLSRQPEGVPLDRNVQVRARLRILIEVAKLLPVSDDIDTLLSKILDVVFQLIEVDYAAILLYDDKTGRLASRIVRTSRPDTESIGAFSQNIVDYVVQKSVAALFADAATDPRFNAARSVVTQSIRAAMCVPLKPREELIGVLYVDNRRSADLYTEEDLEFLVAFAGQAAVALSNASLYRRLEKETVDRMQLIMEAKLASLGGVVAGIAHEIKNPLNFIINFAELSGVLAGELNDALGPRSADVREQIEHLRDNSRRIVEHGRRADAIIESMLKHARRPVGGSEAADLNAIVAESVRLARGGAQAADLEMLIIEEYDPLMGPLDLTVQDIERVFLNVVENAIYAMKQKRLTLGDAFTPELRVHTTDFGDHAEVRIRDNGTGIAPEIADKIYIPFFTTKPPGEGTGLGLSLSHEIVVQGHRGTMKMDSDGQQYTEMIVTLPRRASSPAPAS